MHAQRSHAVKFIFGGMVSLLLTACATSVGDTVAVSAENISKYESLSTAEAIAALETRIENAKTLDMPYLSPNYFKEASAILKAAKEPSKDKSKADLVSSLAKGDAILDKGHSRMDIVQNRFSNELAQKVWLEKYNTAKIFPKEYENSISTLSTLIEKIELEKDDEIDDDKVKLLKTMQELVIRTVQHTELHECKAINEDTQSKGAKERTPATFSEALSAYQDAMNQIALAPHDTESVNRAKTEALFAAHHARHVNERVQILQDKIKDSKEYIETLVRNEEKNLLDISTALGHKDLRDQPIEKQVESIAKAAQEITEQGKAVNSQLKDANERLAEKDLTISTLSNQLEYLSAPAPSEGSPAPTESQLTE